MCRHAGEAAATRWREDDGPWGEQLLAPACNQGDCGDAGHYTESGLGLTYAQARWYDQVAGVFLSTDAVGFGTGGLWHFNLLGYAGNSPFTFHDPDGNARKRHGLPNGGCFEFTCDQFGRMRGAGPGRGGHLDYVNTSVKPGSSANASAPGKGVNNSTVEVTKEGATVIGRVNDLKNLNKGEKSLIDRLPDQGSTQPNLTQN